jgi:hypothetical protein
VLVKGGRDECHIGQSLGHPLIMWEDAPNCLFFGAKWRA